MILRMPTHAASLSVRSSGKGTYEITCQIEKIIAESGITTGTATLSDGSGDDDLLTDAGALFIQEGVLATDYVRLTYQGESYDIPIDSVDLDTQITILSSNAPWSGFGAPSGSYT